MDRDQSFGRRHFSPVADPADMSGIAQRHRGQSRLSAFLDADPDRLRRHGLSVAELAIDHRQRRRIDHDLGGLVRHHRALFFFQRTYTGTRITPWLSWPVRFAVVR